MRKLAQGTHLLVTPIKKISRKGERDRDDAAVGRKFALVKAVSRRQNRLAKEGAADTRGSLEPIYHSTTFIQGTFKECFPSFVNLG